MSVFLSGNIFERKEEGTYRGNAKGNLRIFPTGVNGMGVWVLRVHRSTAIIPCFSFSAVSLFLTWFVFLLPK